MASQPNLRSTYCLFLRRENSTLLPSSWSCSPSTYHCLRVSLASTGGRRKFCSGSKQIKNSKAMPFYFPALIVQRVDQRLYQIMQWNHCNFENYELQMLDMPTKIKDQKWHSPFSLNTKKWRIQHLLSPICYIVRILSPGEWSVCSGNHCTTQERGPALLLFPLFPEIRNHASWILCPVWF